MTYSPDLLKVAKETVHRLLKSHFGILLLGEHKQDKITKILDQSFVIFHEYLYRLLSLSAPDKFNFDEDNFISYPDFRKLWNQDFYKRKEAKKIGVDLAWHIIRTYVKGGRSSAEDELTPDEFNCLPKKRRSVSLETYELVYENVWERWYKRICDERGYWDDQDLVLAVLDSDIIRNLNYSAIFCDEAQDFTSIELELILQLSVFSKRSLRHNQVRNVPFIFAGDPLQTLNPTGFRWENIQADFYDKFSKILDVSHHSSALSVNYKELKFNYRSNPGIVNFCNLIQLVRLSLIGGDKIQPQESWWVQKQVQTVYFDANDYDIQENLSSYPDVVKIVNCDIGEESEYVENDEILKSIDQEDGIYRNILSPGRSKGLEFSRVILYKFGESVPDGFYDLLSGRLNVYDDSEQRLPYEYFLNRLYVAASRAKDQLIIIDSREAIENFWSFATDPSIISQLRSSLKDKDVELWNEDCLSYLVAGTKEAWSGEPIDIKQQAIEFAKRGSDFCDSYLLRQAALSYRSIGQVRDSARCLSKALELEDKFEEAGQNYINEKLYDEAFDCYWRGKCFSSICSMRDRLPSFAFRPETRVSDLMINSHGITNQFLEWLNGYAFDNHSTRLDKLLLDSTWQYVFNSVIQRLNKLNRTDSVNWILAYEIISKLVLKGMSVPYLQQAQFAFNANKLEESVMFFEKSRKLDQPQYYEAKAKVEDFPKNLSWYGKLRNFSEIIKQWKQHPEILSLLQELSSDITSYVLEAALEKNDLKVALSILKARRDLNALNRVLVATLQEENLELTQQGISLLLIALSRANQWQDMLDIIRDKRYRYLTLPHQVHTFEKVMSQSQFYTAMLQLVITEFATSVSLPKESSEIQSPVSEFLFQNFIAQKSLSSVERNGLTIEFVGAAIERAGKVVNAIQFYESILDVRRLHHEKKVFLKNRLIRVLEKHAEILRVNGQTNQAEDRIFKARQYRKELNLGTTYLPDYPVIKSEQVQKFLERKPHKKTESDQQEWQIHCLKCVLFSSIGKVRIENTDLVEMVSFLKSSYQLKGDADFVEESPTSKEELKSWVIQDWNTGISLRQQNDSLSLHINCLGKELDIYL